MDYQLLKTTMHTVYAKYCQAVRNGDMFEAKALEKIYTALYNKRQKFDVKNKQRGEQ